jgi:hypothetical protein
VKAGEISCRRAYRRKLKRQAAKKANGGESGGAWRRVSVKHIEWRVWRGENGGSISMAAMAAASGIASIETAKISVSSNISDINKRQENKKGGGAMAITRHRKWRSGIKQASMAYHAARVMAAAAMAMAKSVACGERQAWRRNSKINDMRAIGGVIWRHLSDVAASAAAKIVKHQWRRQRRKPSAAANGGGVIGGGGAYGGSKQRRQAKLVKSARAYRAKAWRLLKAQRGGLSRFHRSAPAYDNGSGASAPRRVIAIARAISPRARAAAVAAAWRQRHRK